MLLKNTFPLNMGIYQKMNGIRHRLALNRMYRLSKKSLTSYLDKDAEENWEDYRDQMMQTAALTDDPVKNGLISNIVNARKDYNSVSNEEEDFDIEEYGKELSELSLEELAEKNKKEAIPNRNKAKELTFTRLAKNLELQPEEIANLKEGARLKGMFSGNVGLDKFNFNMEKILPQTLKAKETREKGIVSFIDKTGKKMAKDIEHLKKMPVAANIFLGEGMPGISPEDVEGGKAYYGLDDPKQLTDMYMNLFTSYDTLRGLSAMAKTDQAKIAMESVFSSQDFHRFEIMEDILRDNGVDVDGVRDAFDKSKLIGDSPQKRFYRGQNKQQSLNACWKILRQLI